MSGGSARLSATHPDQPQEFAGEDAQRDFAGERLTVDPKGARAALDAALIATHETRDGATLIGLYAEAVESSEAAGGIGAACLFLAHAYVSALQTGDARASEYHRRRKARGREE